MQSGRGKPAGVGPFVTFSDVVRNGRMRPLPAIRSFAAADENRPILVISRSTASTGARIDKLTVATRS